MTRIGQGLVLVAVLAPFLATAYGIVQLWERAVTWRDLALLFGMYVPISLGVTAGFHRMLTHRSFRAHPAVRALILVFGSMAVEGPAIQWAANHLKHHALSDREGDPHSPVDGLVHSHLGWLFNYDRADPNVYCRALLLDPPLLLMDRQKACQPLREKKGCICKITPSIFVDFCQLWQIKFSWCVSFFVKKFFMI